MATFAGEALAAYLDTSEIIEATTQLSRASIRVEEPYTGSYQTPAISWNVLIPNQICDQSFVSNNCRPIASLPRPEAEGVSTLKSYSDLEAGWDGEDADKPMAAAIDEAIQFLQASGDMARFLEPALHVDGSVLLELMNGAKGALSFKGNGTIWVAVVSKPSFAANFDGSVISETIKVAIIG